MFILDTAGPGTVAHSEFHPLLASNHLTVQGSATIGGNDTHGEQLTFSGINDRISFSTGFYGFESEGFRPNNDIDTRVGNVLVQYRPSATLSLIGELRSTEVEKGDLKLLFHDDNFNPNLRDHESFDTLRLGMHRQFGENGDLLAMLQLQDSATAFTIGPSVSTRLDADDEVVDLQHLYRLDRWQLTTGISLFGRDMHEANAIRFELPDPPFLIEQFIENDVSTEHMSAYVYSDHQVTNAVTLTLGASVDELEDRGETQSAFNPKLGMSWTPNSRTTVRAAAFGVLHSPEATKVNILPRLEPTAVAGFNQFYYGSTGDEVARYGVGIDRRLSPDLSYGVELSRRDVDTSIFVLDSSLNISAFPIDASEDSLRVYAYWTFDDSLAFSAELQGDVFDNSGYVLQDGYARLETYRLPLEFRYFRSGGFGAGLRLTYVDQSGDFGESTPVPGAGIVSTLFFDQDRFWVADANLTYRLRGRRGILNLTMHNLLDEEFNFQDLDPDNPRIMPDRLVSFGFTLAL
jgi:hypothetical protein